MGEFKSEKQDTNDNNIELNKNINTIDNQIILDDNSKFVIDIICKMEDKFLDKLEKTNKNFTTTIKVIAICVTIVLGIWEIGYFATPYLTKNYIRNNIGDVTIEESEAKQ